MQTHLNNEISSKTLAWRIRRYAVELTHLAHASHLGSILSLADIIAVLYTDVVRLDPLNPQWSERDRVILSKGHAGVAIYIALAELGFFPIRELKKYCTNGSYLLGHVSHMEVPGVEVSTGSLGHGLPIGTGMALSARSKKEQFRNQVFVVMGDGECSEGAVWEAALFAAHHKLTNLKVVIDANDMQGLGFCNDILNLSPLKAKWEAFGWRVHEVDGHDHRALLSALSVKDTIAPTCIIAHTVKGKGVSFMENNLLWHYRDPQGADYQNAVSELETTRDQP